MVSAMDILNNIDAHTVNREEKLTRSIKKRNDNEALFRKAMAAANKLGEFDKAAAMGYGNNKTRSGD